MTANPNTGHGHVRPRPDGVKARCGGPLGCGVCARELAAAQAGAQPSDILRISREHPPRLITEMWAWVVAEINGGEGVAACEMMIQGQRYMMPLVGADEARIRSLEPQARLVEQRTGQKVSLRRFTAVGQEAQP